MLKLLKNLPFQLVVCICIAIFAADYFPLYISQLSFTLSYLIKECFIFALPFIIFSYITSGLTAFKNQGLLLLLATLAMIILSNALACMFSYGLSSAILPFITSGEIQASGTSCLNIKPLVDWTLPQLLAPEKTMLAAFVVGIGNGFIKNDTITNLFIKMRSCTEWGLKKVLIPLLPIYVFGFLIKLKCEGQIAVLLKSFGAAFIFICVSICVYLLILFIIASRVSKTPIQKLAKELFAPALTGFSTMSSAATMPICMNALQRIVPHNKPFINFILPTTANVNLIADAISITIMCLAIIIIKGGEILSLNQFMVYVFYYCILKFSSAGIPGGGVLVLAPLFQDQLGLDFASTSLITTLYILQDPLLTAGNVIGNSLFSIITERVYSFFNLFKEKPSKT